MDRLGGIWLLCGGRGRGWEVGRRMGDGEWDDKSLGQ